MHSGRHRHVAIVGLLLAASIATLIAGCAPAPPQELSDILGTVKQHATTGDGVSILVENETEEFDTVYDIASVSVGEDATVLIEEDDGYAIATPQDVKNGAEVEIWFEGPVAESYPVQAKAGTVVVR
jgi:hypothetical protein